MRPRLSFRMAYRHVRAGLNRMVLSVLALALCLAGALLPSLRAAYVTVPMALRGE